MAEDDSNPLAELLEATGMSQSELARLLGVPASVINQKANGRRKVLRSEVLLFRILLSWHREGFDIRRKISALDD
ncbi:MAG: helix-turn-helix domain-containing protein [Methyloceanibacter sp.]